jgi:hypothetical protein
MDSNFLFRGTKAVDFRSIQENPSAPLGDREGAHDDIHKILISDCIAIFLTPVAALWIGGILQRRSDGYLTSAGGPGAAVAVGRAQGVARGRVQRSACILVAIA